MHRNWEPCPDGGWGQGVGSSLWPVKREWSCYEHLVEQEQDPPRSL